MPIAAFIVRSTDHDGPVRAQVHQSLDPSLPGTELHVHAGSRAAARDLALSLGLQVTSLGRYAAQLQHGDHALLVRSTDVPLEHVLVALAETLLDWSDRYAADRPPTSLSGVCNLETLATALLDPRRRCADRQDAMRLLRDAATERLQAGEFGSEPAARIDEVETLAALLHDPALPPTADLQTGVHAAVLSALERLDLVHAARALSTLDQMDGQWALFPAAEDAPSRSVHVAMSPGAANLRTR
jgi:hypothetical protein